MVDVTWLHDLSARLVVHEIAKLRQFVPRRLPGAQVLKASLRELVSRGDHARRRLVELQPPKGRLGHGRHDLAEVPAVQRAVLERAVLEESNPQHLDRAAILEIHDHLRVAHEALLVGRETARLTEEVVHRAVRDRMKVTRLRSQEGPDAGAHAHQDRSYRRVLPSPRSCGFLSLLHLHPGSALAHIFPAEADTLVVVRVEREDPLEHHQGLGAVEDRGQAIQAASLAASMAEIEGVPSTRTGLQIARITPFPRHEGAHRRHDSSGAALRSGAVAGFDYKESRVVVFVGALNHELTLVPDNDPFCVGGQNVIVCNGTKPNLLTGQVQLEHV
jgi:hypothetical protein